MKIYFNDSNQVVKINEIGNRWNWTRASDFQFQQNCQNHLIISGENKILQNIVNYDSSVALGLNDFVVNMPLNL